MSAAMLTLTACGRPVPPPETSGTLLVATRNSPFTYFIDQNDEPAGFEHDLIAAFVRQQNWAIEWVEEDAPEAIFDLLDQHRVNLAAAALPRQEVRDRHLIASPVLFETPVYVVVRAGNGVPRNVARLAGRKLALIAGSGHSPMLARLKRKHPRLNWVTLQDIWPDAMLEQLQEGAYDAVVINGMNFDPVRNLYPDLAVAFKLPDTQKIVWAFPTRGSPILRNALTRFIEQAQRDGTLERIRERYFGHVKQLDSSDVFGILQRRPQRLPELRRHFQEAQALTGIDWRLLAAIGYQESQWDAYATSPTGVRGLMMLTGETADRMGVADRLDARQSILGGARYLALMKDSLPDRIAEPDRTWLALAAYNQGQGHMEDARRIAQARGGNPDSWADVKQALPHLSRGTYARAMKYGFARGGEALHFAENIRNYYDILLRLEPEYRPPLSLGKREGSRPDPG